MNHQKRYLDVPYAQKDQAKALGARWDATRKKWYIPKEIEIAPFAQWNPVAVVDDDLPVASDKRSTGGSTKPATASVQVPTTVAHTQPLDKNFLPYCGDTPPWD